MGIVVDTIEPYTFWKSSLIDAILKYGDRLYTTSLPNAAKPPRLTVDEVSKAFHVTNFNVSICTRMKGHIKDITETVGTLNGPSLLPRSYN